MKLVIIIAIAFVLLIPLPIFAQYMGNVGDTDQTGTYTLKEALEIQKRRIEASEANPTPIPTHTPTPTPTTSGASVPTDYVIVGIIIAVAIGIVIVLSKRKKSAPVITAQSAKAQTKSDETQFWVCPNCGRDTQMKDGRQYCSSCKIYLSI